MSSDVDNSMWNLDDRIITVNVIDDENFGYNIILPGAEIFTSFEDYESVVLKVPEEETGTFSFALTGEPTEDVTVAVGEASDKFDVSPEAATFTPENWGSFQTFTIMPTDDADAVDELGVITLTGASTDGGYDDTPTRLLCSLMMTKSSSTSQVIASTWMKEAPPQLT